MDFELLSAIRDVAVIATGRQIRDLKRLQKAYGRARWRKLRGKALVRFIGTAIVRIEEVHWYEAHGIGKHEIKIKYRPR